MISGGFNISIFGLSPKPTVDTFQKALDMPNWGLGEKPSKLCHTVVHPNVTLLLSRFFILSLFIFVYLFFSSILGTQTRTSLTSCTTSCGHDAYVFVFIVICLLMLCRLLLTIVAGRRQSSILNPNWLWSWWWQLITFTLERCSCTCKQILCCCNQKPASSYISCSLVFRLWLCFFFPHFIRNNEMMILYLRMQDPIFNWPASEVYQTAFSNYALGLYQQ